MNEENNEIVLSFLPSPHIEEYLEKIGAPEDLMEFTVKVEDIEKWFKGYKVDTIELWIEGAIKEDKVTKLFVSSEGKGGCKATLKPV
jgi:hypothetical protein